MKEEVIDDNIILSDKFDLEVQNVFKTLPIMCWLPKMHKTLTGVTPPRKCSTKALSKAVTKAFKLTFKHASHYSL